MSTHAHNNALDYSAGGPGVKSSKILIGREGMVENWGRIDPDNPDVAYSQYVRHKTPQWVNKNYKALNDAMANGTTYTDVFGNTWTPVSPIPGTIPLKANKFTITPFNRENIVKNTNGKPIYRTLEEAISDLFGSTRPENSENNKAKYD